jgi:hypothetical protein
MINPCYHPLLLLRLLPLHSSTSRHPLLRKAPLAVLSLFGHKTGMPPPLSFHSGDNQSDLGRPVKTRSRIVKPRMMLLSRFRFLLLNQSYLNHPWISITLPPQTCYIFRPPDHHSVYTSCRIGCNVALELLYQISLVQDLVPLLVS